MTLKPHDACPECKIGTLKKAIEHSGLKCTVCKIEFYWQINAKRLIYAKPNDTKWRVYGTNDPTPLTYYPDPVTLK